MRAPKQRLQKKANVCHCAKLPITVTLHDRAVKKDFLKRAHIFTEHPALIYSSYLIQDSCSIKVIFEWVDKNGFCICAIPIRQTPNFSHTPKTKTFPQQEIIAYRLSRRNWLCLPLWKANNCAWQTVLFNISPEKKRKLIDTMH